MKQRIPNALLEQIIKEKVVITEKSTIHLALDLKESREQNKKMQEVLEKLDPVAWNLISKSF